MRVNDSQWNYENNGKIHQVAIHKDNAWLEEGLLIDCGSDDHMVPKGMFNSPITPKENGRKVKFELANGRLLSPKEHR